MLVGRSAARLVEKSNKMVMSEKICRLLLFIMEGGGGRFTGYKQQISTDGGSLRNLYSISTEYSTEYTSHRNVTLCSNLPE